MPTPQLSDQAESALKQAIQLCFVAFGCSLICLGTIWASYGVGVISGVAATIVIFVTTQVHQRVVLRHRQGICWCAQRRLCPDCVFPHLWHLRNYLVVAGFCSFFSAIPTAAVGAAMHTAALDDRDCMHECHLPAADRAAQEAGCASCAKFKSSYEAGAAYWVYDYCAAFTCFDDCSSNSNTCAFGCVGCAECEDEYYGYVATVEYSAYCSGSESYALELSMGKTCPDMCECLGGTPHDSCEETRTIAIAGYINAFFSLVMGTISFIAAARLSVVLPELLKHTDAPFAHAPTVYGGGVYGNAAPGQQHMQAQVSPEMHEAYLRAAAAPAVTGFVPGNVVRGAPVQDAGDGAVQGTPAEDDPKDGAAK